MRLRKFEDGDLEALGALMQLAFGGDIAPAERYFDPEKNPRVNLDRVFVVEEDEEGPGECDGAALGDVRRR